MQLTASVSVTSHKFRLYGPNTSRRLQRVVTKYTLILEALMKRYAPVDTGRLRSLIHHELLYLAGLVRVDVNYARHVVLGTRYQKANDFPTKAVEEIRDAFIRECLRALKPAA